MSQAPCHVISHFDSFSSLSLPSPPCLSLSLPLSSSSLSLLLLFLPIFLLPHYLSLSHDLSSSLFPTFSSSFFFSYLSPSPSLPYLSRSLSLPPLVPSLAWIGKLKHCVRYRVTRAFFRDDDSFPRPHINTCFATLVYNARLWPLLWSKTLKNAIFLKCAPKCVSSSTANFFQK